MKSKLKEQEGQPEEIFFFYLIFLMQISLWNEKSSGKQDKGAVATKTFLVRQWYLHRKNKVWKGSALGYLYNTYNLDKWPYIPTSTVEKKKEKKKNKKKRKQFIIISIPQNGMKCNYTNEVKLWSKCFRV